MTELQAALGRSQLKRLDAMHERRLALAARYDRLLAGAPLRLPARRADRVSAWHLYAVEVDRGPRLPSRAQVFQALRAAGIGVNVHYSPIPAAALLARARFQRRATSRRPRPTTPARCRCRCIRQLTDAQQQLHVVDTLLQALQRTPVGTPELETS
jgi:dTDP-4-amino-4,6-dideoxygalactose transaminase